jgi:hypothetical protein
MNEWMSACTYYYQLSCTRTNISYRKQTYLYKQNKTPDQITHVQNWALSILPFPPSSCVPQKNYKGWFFRWKLGFSFRCTAKSEFIFMLFRDPDRVSDIYILLCFFKRFFPIMDMDAKGHMWSQLITGRIRNLLTSSSTAYYLNNLYEHWLLVFVAIHIAVAKFSHQYHLD